MKEVKIIIPTFDYRLNKNTREKLSRMQFGKSDGYKKLLNSFEMLIRANLNAKGIKFEHPESIDVTLLVYRPNTKHDAQNYGDEFWDIIKRALGIDDRHFTTHAIPKDPDGPDDKTFYPHFEIILRGE